MRWTDCEGEALVSGIRRRDFVILLGGGAGAWPLAARAQQQRKLPTIGFLGTASRSAWSGWVAAFVQRIGELGWVEGRTVTIEYRWAEGRSERFTEIATEFVHRKVDLIVTGGAAVLGSLGSVTQGKRRSAMWRPL
jgi:putative ABC transport system substrate-binding protein